MKIFYYIAIAFITALLLSTFLSSGQDNIYMAPHVDQYVQEVSENYPNEVLACFDHFELFDDVYIYNYEMPYTIEADGVSVAGIACEEQQISFHNHPPHNPPPSVKNYIERETGHILKSPKQHVFLSNVDMIGAWDKGHPYTIVASDGNYAWWTQEQIRRALEREELLLEPIEGQKNF